MRGTDGSYTAPEAEARQLQADMTGWCIWYGQRTGRFWAATRTGQPRLVEARTAGDLVARMSWARNTVP